MDHFHCIVSYQHSCSTWIFMFKTEPAAAGKSSLVLMWCLHSVPWRISLPSLDILLGRNPTSVRHVLLLQDHGKHCQSVEPECHLALKQHYQLSASFVLHAAAVICHEHWTSDKYKAWKYTTYIWLLIVICLLYFHSTVKKCVKWIEENKLIITIYH